jgi:AcrR family transcriptional regulator
MRTRAATRKGGYHHGDLRNALVAAALKLVAKQGAEGFSLREAARAVGVSPAAAYRHFEDRSALLKALAHEGLARLALEMEEAVANAPGAPGSRARAAAELAAIGAVYVEFAVAHAPHFRVMFGPWCDLADELAPELLPHGRDPLQLLVDTLDGMVRAGAITAAARRGAEISAWSAVHGLASLLVEGGLPLGAAERARACGAVQRMILLGLGASPELAGPPLAATLPELRPHPENPEVRPRRSSRGAPTTSRLRGHSPGRRATGRGSPGPGAIAAGTRRRGTTTP